MKDIVSSLKMDLFFWNRIDNYPINWEIGAIQNLPTNLQAARSIINKWAINSDSEFGIFWSNKTYLPSHNILKSLNTINVDLAHAGLQLGVGNYWPDLCMIKQDWSMINAPSNVPSSSWRCSLEACLIRRTLWLELDGIDPAFTCLESAGLDLGYRALQIGAIVENRPELITQDLTEKEKILPLHDLYAFVYRHYGLRWTKYLNLRRSISNLQVISEKRAMNKAISACEKEKRRSSIPIAHIVDKNNQPNLSKERVSVIIPTLGRYKYIPQALKSINDQTIKPIEVIIVDQNAADQRQKDMYEGYPELNIKVIWQDERGQSLARNTGLEIALGEYVLLFDDDSIASPDLIEQHLISVLSGDYDVSTGVAFPPPPEEYILPDNFNYPRIAQTFDTGNCLLRRDLAYKMGGFDRNYDFGPGTDADFGTRLYLAGYRILHNPNAKRIHFKAESGGLRVHGARKYNTDAGLLAPFPPVTRTYYALRYLTKQQRHEMAFLSFILSKFPKKVRGSMFNKGYWFAAYIAFTFKFIIFPLKVMRSKNQVRKLINQSPRLSEFSIHPLIKNNNFDSND